MPARLNRKSSKRLILSVLLLPVLACLILAGIIIWQMSQGIGARRDPAPQPDTPRNAETDAPGTSAPQDSAPQDSEE